MLKISKLLNLKLSNIMIILMLNLLKNIKLTTLIIILLNNNQIKKFNISIIFYEFWIKLFIKFVYIY